MITFESLPLLGLFNRLRDQHGWPLGIEEYKLVLQTLQAGFGIEDQHALEHLCCVLWAKSLDEARLLHQLFELYLTETSVRWSDASPSLEPLTPQQKDTVLPPVESPSPVPPEPASVGPMSVEPGKPSTPLLTRDLDEAEPFQAVQAIRHRGIQDLEIQRPHYGLLAEYFPVTRRQMKQGWRHLRRMVREGPPKVLDVMATIEKVGRDGILLDSVLVPRRINRAELLLLVDQDGSMVPFHALSRQLVETARRGGKLGRAGVYYFHDHPGDYLYRDPAYLEYQATLDVLATLNEHVAVLIVSDAGAARGRYDAVRVTQIQKFLQELKQTVRHCAWLNPMPSTRWANTTAGEIARLVPMFEMSQQGLESAIRVLRGYHVRGSRVGA